MIDMNFLCIHMHIPLSTNIDHMCCYILDSYSSFSSQSIFPHNAHRFSGGTAGKRFSKDASCSLSKNNFILIRNRTNSIMAVSLGIIS